MCARSSRRWWTSILLSVDSDGTWRVSLALAGRSLPVPASVRDRVRARFERLTPAATEVAGAVAVLGGPAAATVVEEVAEVSPDATEVAVAELVLHRALRESESQPGHYEFASPLVGRAVAAILPATKRRALHARAADVLVKRDLAATAERSLLPYHLARAESQPAAPRAISVPRSWKKRAAMAGATVAGVAALLATQTDLFGPRFRSVDGGEAAASGIPVVALGRITDYREAGAANVTKPLIDMLATNLGRVSGMRVVSTARMYELVSQTSRGGDSAAAVVGAARRAGATELVDGAIYPLEGGGMRLDLRRVEIATGNMRKTHSVNGNTLFELADSGTARLAADFGAATPNGSIADVTTRSLGAYRLYEEGLRAFYENERASAQQLFDAALAEDSTFAMAAYYAALTRRDNFREIAPHFQRALRLVSHTSERERLTIRAQWALLTSSPALSALADSLTRRYPQDVEGHLFSGIGLFKQGRYPESIRALERAVAMDSVSVVGGNPGCSACDGLEYLVRAYRYNDDYPGAERVVRRWIRLQPRSAQALEQLHGVLGALGRSQEALEVLHRRASLSPGVAAREPVIAAQLQLIARDFPAAERLLTGVHCECRRFVAYCRRGLVPRHDVPRSGEAARSARCRATLSRAVAAGAGHGSGDVDRRSTGAVRVRSTPTGGGVVRYGRNWEPRARLTANLCAGAGLAAGAGRDFIGGRRRQCGIATHCRHAPNRGHAERRRARSTTPSLCARVVFRDSPPG